MKPKHLLQLLFILLYSLSLLTSNQLQAKTYLSQNEFVQLVEKNLSRKTNKEGIQFNKKSLWLKSDLQNRIKTILGHPYRKIRITYRWSIIDKKLVSLWFLDEIGKERPISFGIWVEGGKVQQIRVLAFRESRGGEIAMPAFEQQFTGNFLKADGNFVNQIDGITGATLSVRAMKKIAKLAIMLHQWLETHEKSLE